MKKQKVLFLSAANSVHTVRWVNALVNSYEMHLVYCKNHKPKIDAIDSKVVLHELSIPAPFGYYLNSLKLKNIYNNIKPDIINTHYASGYGTLVRLANIKPVLLSVWGSDVYDFPNRSRRNKKILEKNVLYADEISSTSHAMANELKKVVQKLSKEILIIPFGVDTKKFKKVKDNHDTINIGNIKTLEPIYAIEDGILSIKRLRENLINKGERDLADSIRFFVYGSGYEKEKLEELIKKEKLEEFVFLKGRIPNTEVPLALSNLDIFCVTSKKESFGVSVVEAMSCEVPVVATDVDGFKEVIDVDETGFISKVGDISDIANKLEILIKDKVLRNQMGNNGRKKVIKEYDWDNNVKLMKENYKKIISQERRKKFEWNKEN